MTHVALPPPARTARKAVAMALAFCLGGATTYLATGPSALAAATVAGIDGPGWMARLHGQSHAGLHAHVADVLARAGVDAGRQRQVDAIVGDAMQAEHADLQRYHATWGALRSLLAAPRIDEGAVEKVRAEQDALLADASRRMSETAVQVARTLTPAQRHALSAEIDRRMASGHHARD